MGARVFAYIPQEGYVGVAVVEDTMKPIKVYFAEIDGEKKPILECILKNLEIRKNSDNLELCEYLVKVKWIKTIRREEAYKEPDMFANQNMVCKLRNEFTPNKLYKYFGLNEME